MIGRGDVVLLIIQGKQYLGYFIYVYVWKFGGEESRGKERGGE